MPSRRYRTFAFAVLAYSVGVILWGAYVRATGSGAGCGDHWPLCNGEIIPRTGGTETLVELTHRLTSGLAWVAAFALAWWARHQWPAGHHGRRAAWASFALMSTEALVGASIVLLEHVADDARLGRGVWMAAHLINTFLLLAALALTAWYAAGGPRVRLRGQGLAAWAMAGSLAGVLLIGVSGAVTALGDTLFPATSFSEGMSPTAHVFLQLRILHPLIALVVGLVLLATAGYLAGSRPGGGVRPLAATVVATYALQVGLGFLNVYLHAPVWMQVLHLLVADAIWLSAVWLAAAALGHSTEIEASVTPRSDSSRSSASAIRAVSPR